ncbi:hypothetical protein CF336_g7458, partial [Tilletia laevis]
SPPQTAHHAQQQQQHYQPSEFYHHPGYSHSLPPTPDPSVPQPGSALGSGGPISTFPSSASSTAGTTTIRSPSRPLSSSSSSSSSLAAHHPRFHSAFAVRKATASGELVSRQLGPIRTKHKSKILNYDRKKICEYHLDNPSHRQDDIAALFGIERSTVSRILKDQDGWLAMNNQSDAARIAKHRTGRYPALEARLSDWADGLIARNRRQRWRAQFPGSQLGAWIGLEGSFRTSLGWCEKFGEKKGLSQRRPVQIMVQFETPPKVERPRTSQLATQPVPSAVARFFATPELVLIVLDHLLADRIDLPVVASVCRRLRTPALQAWVRNLDFHHHGFKGKLELLQANTHLLAHVRYLRIFNCVEWFDIDNPNRKRPPSFWNQIKTLFSLLAAHTPSHAEGPLLDILIDVDDGDALYQALQPHPNLTQRIAALRLFDLCRFLEGRIRRSFDRYSTSGWISLTLLLKDALPHASSAENLRVVEYKCYSVSQEVEFRWAAKEIFWSTLAAQCRSLRELGLFISFGYEAKQLLLQASFPSLKSFELKDLTDDEDPLNVEAVTAFLDRHTGLERLHLAKSDLKVWPLGFKQNFPALQELYLGGGISLWDEGVLDLIRRQSRLRRLATWTKAPAGQLSPLRALFRSSPDTFKHLPSAENASVAELNESIKDGARPFRAEAKLTKPAANRTSGNSDDNPFSELGMEAWEGVRPEGLKHLTFLQVTPEAHLVDPDDWHFGQLFASDLFPNLTELHFRLYDEEGDIPALDVLFRHLAPSTSLRVLGIFDRDRHAPDLPAILLTRHVFPVRFEVLCWSQEQDFLRYSYFRFVADSAETQGSASTSATQVGKLGRLQAVPARIILTQVGSDGVWHQKPNIGGGAPTATFLNHNGT